MTRYAAFLRGVNLGKRSVKSADLKSAFEAMGYDNVKTLLASGNVLFDARAAKGLKEKLEAGLHEAFGFKIGVVLRSIDELKAIAKSDPFNGIAESEAAKLHVTLTAEPLPKGFAFPGIKGDFDIPRIDPREIFIIAYRKPDGTYLGNSAIDLEKGIPKGTLATTRNWNTILKAIA
ncbi:MAG TPA: DUF1697 domain-containing protein [Devosia sp.]|nr:DUF1697 domain-containing protein [Devosia sp.]